MTEAVYYGSDPVSAAAIFSCVQRNQRDTSVISRYGTLLNKNMKKEDLRIAVGLTTNMIANMGKNKGISKETLAKICEVLQCEIADVIEQTEEPTKEDEKDVTDAVC